MMDITVIIELIQGVGFPIFVAVYLMIVLKVRITENTEILKELKTIIESKL